MIAKINTVCQAAYAHWDEKFQIIKKKEKGKEWQLPRRDEDKKKRLIELKYLLLHRASEAIKKSPGLQQPTQPSVERQPPQQMHSTKDDQPRTGKVGEK